MNHLHLQYFFWGSGYSEQRNRYGFYKSLPFQLLSNIPSAGAEYWRVMRLKDRHHDPQDLNLNELPNLFQSALSNACDVSRVRLFVDALDGTVETELREVVADLRKLNKLIN
jgi:hypothetical protein